MILVQHPVLVIVLLIALFVLMLLAVCNAMYFYIVFLINCFFRKCMDMLVQANNAKLSQTFVKQDNIG